MEKIKMDINFYSIRVENDIVAQHMPLQYALMLIKVIYNEFYAEPTLKVTIEKEKYTEDNSHE